MKYIDEFVKLKCSSNMLNNKLFPNGKEITESFACYNAVRKYIWEKVSPQNNDVIFFAVGDGHQPRTGATFAYRTKWTCISIDPLLRLGNNIEYIKHPNINRLFLLKNKVENIKNNLIDLSNKTVIIGLVHSHADIEKTYEKLKGYKTYVISIPCCVKHERIKNKIPDICYIDNNILSEKNEVKIWCLDN
jgi:hypothetical protein